MTRILAPALLCLALAGCGAVQQGAAALADKTESAIDTLIVVNREAVGVAMKEVCEGIRLQVYREQFQTPERQAAHNALCRKPDVGPIAP